MGTVTRVGIVGQGHVVANVANSLILKGISDELVLCDIIGSNLAA